MTDEERRLAHVETEKDRQAALNAPDPNELAQDSEVYEVTYNPRGTFVGDISVLLVPVELGPSGFPQSLDRSLEKAIAKARAFMAADESEGLILSVKKLDGLLLK